MHVRSTSCMSAFQPGSQALSGVCQQVLFFRHADHLTCQGSTGDASIVGLERLLTDTTQVYLLASLAR